jgi:hypothetical protein
MAQGPRIIFPHRRNGDGTYDSICPHCFVTVARQRDEASLKEAEASHICFTGRDEIAISFRNHIYR